MGAEDFPINKIEQPVSIDDKEQVETLESDNQNKTEEPADNKSEEYKNQLEKSERKQRVKEWLASIDYFVRKLDNKMSDPNVINHESASETLIAKGQAAVQNSPDVKQYIETGEPKDLDMLLFPKWETFEMPDGKGGTKEVIYATSVDIIVGKANTNNEPQKYSEQSLLNKEEEELLKNKTVVNELILKRNLPPPGGYAFS